MVWFSGNSALNDRGSLMAYLPIAHGYWVWYASFHGAETGWTLSEHLGIAPEELQSFRYLSDQPVFIS